MPIYEYRCQHCGDEFEALQKLSDRPLTKCKKCGGHVEKLLSRSAFVLKGGGWYADGYKSGKSSMATDTAPKGKSGEASKSATSEAKGTD